MNIKYFVSFTPDALNVVETRRFNNKHELHLFLLGIDNNMSVREVWSA